VPGAQVRRNGHVENRDRREDLFQAGARLQYHFPPASGSLAGFQFSGISLDQTQNVIGTPRYKASTLEQERF
jgi:hypothetical protein